MCWQVSQRKIFFCLRHWALVLRHSGLAEERKISKIRASQEDLDRWPIPFFPSDKFWEAWEPHEHGHWQAQHLWWPVLLLGLHVPVYNNENYSFIFPFIRQRFDRGQQSHDFFFLQVLWPDKYVHSGDCNVYVLTPLSAPGKEQMNVR